MTVGRLFYTGLQQLTCSAADALEQAPFLIPVASLITAAIRNEITA